MNRTNQMKIWIAIVIVFLMTSVGYLMLTTDSVSEKDRNVRSEVVENEATTDVESGTRAHDMNPFNGGYIEIDGKFFDYDVRRDYSKTLRWYWLDAQSKGGWIPNKEEITAWNNVRGRQIDGSIDMLYCRDDDGHSFGYTDNPMCSCDYSASENENLRNPNNGGCIFVWDSLYSSGARYSKYSNETEIAKVKAQPTGYVYMRRYGSPGNWWTDYCYNYEYSNGDYWNVYYYYYPNGGRSYVYRGWARWDTSKFPDNNDNLVKATMVAKCDYAQSRNYDGGDIEPCAVVVTELDNDPRNYGGESQFNMLDDGTTIKEKWEVSTGDMKIDYTENLDHLKDNNWYALGFKEYHEDQDGYVYYNTNWRGASMNFEYPAPTYYRETFTQPFSATDFGPAWTNYSSDAENGRCERVDTDPPPKGVYTFTPAGKNGNTGPSQSQVTNAYSGTNLENQVTVSSGIQSWTAPATDTYTIEVFGAQGGQYSSRVSGGKGARMKADFTLQQGTTLKILVGQTGARGGGVAEPLWLTPIITQLL